MNRIEKISILLGDVALPLMGYLFWHWDLYFILLFFILDQLSRTVFLPWRLKLTSISIKDKNLLIFQQFMLFLIELLVIHGMVYMQTPSINFGKEIISFLTYKDMGIQQGFVLLPLVIAGEWMRINNELKLGLIGKHQILIIDQNKRNSIIRICFFSFLIGILNLFNIQESGLVISFLALIILLFFLTVKK